MLIISTAGLDPELDSGRQDEFFTGLLRRLAMTGRRLAMTGERLAMTSNVAPPLLRFRAVAVSIILSPLSLFISFISFISLYLSLSPLSPYPYLFA